MRVFGPDLPAEVLSEEKMAIPVGEPCYHCGEIFTADDRGVGAPTLPFHTPCFKRSTFGSVGHLECRCSCYGGDYEDPPGMTKRQAAELAAALFDVHERMEPPVTDQAKREIVSEIGFIAAARGYISSQPPPEDHVWRVLALLHPEPPRVELYAGLSPISALPPDEVLNHTSVRATLARLQPQVGCLVTCKLVGHPIFGGILVPRRLVPSPAAAAAEAARVN